jgi:hypothetical protein
MPYNKRLMEQFAMKADEMASGIPTFAGSVDVDAVGASLGLSPVDSRGIALYLQELRWAVFSYTGVKATLTLTPLGFDEIAKLRLPRWRRFVRTYWPEFAIALASGLLAGLVLWALTRLT